MTEEIRSKLWEKINEKGYGFQQAVIERVMGIAPWQLEATEYPVNVQNRDTRIDFILRHENQKVRIVAECKRVNPAYSDWCFLSNKHISSSFSTDQVILEKYRYQHQQYADPITYLLAQSTSQLGSKYQVGIAIKSEKKGNSGGAADDDAIEKAASQVFAGVNGLIQEYDQRIKKLDLKNVGNMDLECLFVPVIFTTATLWVTDAKLSDASLETGDIDREKLKPSKRNYLWLQYHVSKGIKHEIEGYRFNKEYDIYLDKILAEDYIRHVAIVNYAGVEDFLRSLNR